MSAFNWAVLFQKFVAVLREEEGQAYLDSLGGSLGEEFSPSELFAILDILENDNVPPPL